jgi:polar amino acid transport system permease protein
MLDAIALWLSQVTDTDWPSILHYLGNGKHMAWYASFRFTIGAAIFGALLALIFGLIGAFLSQSSWLVFRWLGAFYINIVRGVPDVLFFLFFPLAFEQTVEYFSAQSLCTAQELAAAASWPPCEAAQWFLNTTDYFVLACFSLGIVYGAFTASVIKGAMGAVPKGQLEAAYAYGFSRRQVFWRFQVRQMWVYALPGLSNVWMLLLKATSLLSLLQIADIVLWADRLGTPNYFARVGLVHPDWRWKYYLVLFLFYIFMAILSDWVFAKLQSRASRGLVSVS